VMVPDFSMGTGPEANYLALGKLPPADYPCGSAEGTVDCLGVAYHGDFLEGLFDDDLFEPGEGLFTG